MTVSECAEKYGVSRTKVKKIWDSMINPKSDEWISKINKKIGRLGNEKQYTKERLRTIDIQKEIVLSLCPRESVIIEFEDENDKRKFKHIVCEINKSVKDGRFFSRRTIDEISEEIYCKQLCLHPTKLSL